MVTPIFERLPKGKGYRVETFKTGGMTWGARFYAGKTLIAESSRCEHAGAAIYRAISSGSCKPRYWHLRKIVKQYDKESI